MTQKLYKIVMMYSPSSSSYTVYVLAYSTTAAEEKANEFSHTNEYLYDFVHSTEVIASTAGEHPFQLLI